MNWVTCNTQTKLNLAITFSLIMTIQRASIFFYCPLKKGAKQTEMIESWILFAKPCQGCIIKKLHLGNHSVSIQKIFLQLLPHFEVITCLINYLFCKWRGLCPPRECRRSNLWKIVTFCCILWQLWLNTRGHRRLLKFCDLFWI